MREKIGFTEQFTISDSQNLICIICGQNLRWVFYYSNGSKNFCGSCVRNGRVMSMIMAER